MDFLKNQENISKILNGSPPIHQLYSKPSKPAKQWIKFNRDIHLNVHLKNCLNAEQIVLIQREDGRFYQKECESLNSGKQASLFLNQSRMANSQQQIDINHSLRSPGQLNQSTRRKEWDNYEVKASPQFFSTSQNIQIKVSRLLKEKMVPEYRPVSLSVDQSKNLKRQVEQSKDNERLRNKSAYESRLIKKTIIIDTLDLFQEDDLLNRNYDLEEIPEQQKIIQITRIRNQNDDQQSHLEQPIIQPDLQEDSRQRQSDFQDKKLIIDQVLNDFDQKKEYEHIKSSLKPQTVTVSKILSQMKKKQDDELPIKVKEEDDYAHSPKNQRIQEPEFEPEQKQQVEHITETKEIKNPESQTHPNPKTVPDTIKHPQNMQPYLTKSNSNTNHLHLSSLYLRKNLQGGKSSNNQTLTISHKELQQPINQIYFNDNKNIEQNVHSMAPVINFLKPNNSERIIKKKQLNSLINYTVAQRTQKIEETEKIDPVFTTIHYKCLNQSVNALKNNNNSNSPGQGKQSQKLSRSFGSKKSSLTERRERSPKIRENFNAQSLSLSNLIIKKMENPEISQIKGSEQFKAVHIIKQIHSDSDQNNSEEKQRFKNKILQKEVGNQDSLQSQSEILLNSSKIYQLQPKPRQIDLSRELPQFKTIATMTKFEDEEQINEEAHKSKKAPQQSILDKNVDFLEIFEKINKNNQEAKSVTEQFLKTVIQPNKKAQINQTENTTIQKPFAEKIDPVPEIEHEDTEKIPILEGKFHILEKLSLNRPQFVDIDRVGKDYLMFHQSKITVKSLTRVKDLQNCSSGSGKEPIQKEQVIAVNGALEESNKKLSKMVKSNPSIANHRLSEPPQPVYEFTPIHFDRTTKKRENFLVLPMNSALQCEQKMIVPRIDIQPNQQADFQTTKSKFFEQTTGKIEISQQQLVFDKNIGALDQKVQNEDSFGEFLHKNPGVEAWSNQNSLIDINQMIQVPKKQKKSQN